MFCVCIAQPYRCIVPTPRYINGLRHDRRMELCALNGKMGMLMMDGMEPREKHIEILINAIIIVIIVISGKFAAAATRAHASAPIRSVVTQPLPTATSAKGFRPAISIENGDQITANAHRTPQQWSL